MKKLILCALIFLGADVLRADSTTATMFASSCVDNASVGANAWTNPGNAVGNPDGNDATESGTSQYLYCSGFGFSIPVNAVIKGITSHAWKFSPNAVLDNSVTLFINGVSSGTNKANISVDWPASLTAYAYGSPTDTWGTSPTPSIVNSSNFGIGIAIQKDAGGTNTGHVDAVDLAIAYNEGTTINSGTIYGGTMR